MKIEYNDLHMYVGKPVLFKWCEGRRRNGALAIEWEDKKRILKYKIDNNVVAFKDFFSNKHLGMGYALKEEYGTVWYVELLEYDIKLSNIGRSICLKCSCATEKRRDFSTFKIREFCPRCKI